MTITYADRQSVVIADAIDRLLTLAALHSLDTKQRAVENLRAFVTTRNVPPDEDERKFVDAAIAFLLTRRSDVASREFFTPRGEVIHRNATNGEPTAKALDELAAGVYSHCDSANSPLAVLVHNLFVRMKELDGPIGKGSDDYKLLWDAIIDEIRAIAGEVA